MADSATPPNESPYPREVSAGGVTLTRTPDQVYLELSATLPQPKIDALLTQYRLRPLQEAPAISPENDRNARPRRGRWLQFAGGGDVVPLVAALRGDDRVHIANPVYHRTDLLPAVTGASFADRLLIRFNPGATAQEIEALIAALSMEVSSSVPDPHEGDLYQLQLRSPQTQDVFGAVEEFAQSPLVRYAGPDWIQLHRATSAITPNDEHFAQQWNLHRIGAPGAWDISQGSSSVVIAIIDTGCDLTHPDLSAKFVPQADRRDVVDGTDTPDDVGGHGTLCAGVAAADTNNTQEGVAGVGWACSIMPIRLIDGNDNIQSEMDIVNAVDWARIHGADVISMSWYWDLPHANAEVALDNAHTGGVLIVAASGNCFPQEGCVNPAIVTFPASHQRVIAVGASDENDKRKQPVLGEAPQWGSKYGTALSVVAPGVIPWTTSNGGGYSGFWGTSAAAPHVAGLAGLLIALLQKPVNIPPGLQIHDLVRNIIEQTAAKVGGSGYTMTTGYPNGTWYEEMGYGRIDAAAALRYARDNYTTYLMERPSWAYAISVQILLGLTGGGGGVVLPHGGGPVPVDPGWNVLAPEKRDVLLGLAVTQLAEGVADPEVRQALRQAGKEAIKRAAQRIGHD
jgi:subtilisin family serine protease